MYDSSARPWLDSKPSPPQPPQPPKPKFGRLPDPPLLTGDELTVDDAWLLFGIPKKRGAKDEVKQRYLEFVAKYHPDKPENAGTTDQLKRANLAWALLQKHCRW
jgi:hypothetical protein